MNVSHNPEAIRCAYLGPIVKNEVERIKYSFSKGVAPSFVPDQLLYKDYDWTKRDVETLMLRPAVDLTLLIQLQEDIQNQFEVRIALFWTQVLFLYKTRLHVVFFNGTDAQVGIPGVGRGPSNGDFACVHMATNPAIRVLANDRGDVIALGQKSFLHLNANATAWLPKIVNDVDCLLDLHSTVGGQNFRLTTTQILYSVSGGLLTPLDGLKWFLHFSNLHLQECFRKAPSQESQYVISLYYNVVCAYYQMINEEQDLPLSGYDVIHDEEICMNAQAIMHKAFIEEMRALQPMMVAPTQNALSFNHFEEMNWRLTWFLLPVKESIKGAILTHANHCASAANVRQAAINFFASMESLEVFYYELFSIGNKSISNRAMQLNTAIRQTLSVERPHNYHLIVLKILELCAVRP